MTSIDDLKLRVQPQVHPGAVVLTVDGEVDLYSTERGSNTWYSGKNHEFSGNIQVISDSNRHPPWVSPVRPGSMHDLRCARELVLPTLDPFCRLGPDGHSLLPVLADKGYIGAGIGVRVPAPSPRRRAGAGP